MWAQNIVGIIISKFKQLKRAQMNENICEAYSEYQLSESNQNQSSLSNSKCVKKQKKKINKLRKERLYRLKKHGSWSNQEDYKFVSFIESHLKIFQDKDLRRRKKIFQKMAKFIKSRSSQQCRSHHQKYQIRFPSHDDMISHIKLKLQPIGEQLKPEMEEGYGKIVPVGLYFGTFGYFNVSNQMEMCNPGKEEPVGSLPQAYDKKNEPKTQCFLGQLLMVKGKGYEVAVQSGEQFQVIVRIDMENFLDST